MKAIKYCILLNIKGLLFCISLSESAEEMVNVTAAEVQRPEEEKPTGKEII